MREIRVAGFLPSTHGFRFGNTFPRGSRYPAVPLPLLGRIVRLDAAQGLCGGLVFAVLDLVAAGRTPTRTAEPPAVGSPLFSYLVRRQRASVLALDPRTPITNGGKTVRWALRRAPAPHPDGPLVAATVREWAAVRADLDAGKLSPVFLVAGPRSPLRRPAALLDALRRSHQVLAYAYTVSESGRVTLRILDPNDPADDGSELILDPDDAADPISAPHAARLLGADARFRGFFRAAYRPAQPDDSAG